MMFLSNVSDDDAAFQTNRSTWFPRSAVSSAFPLSAPSGGVGGHSICGVFGVGAAAVRHVQYRYTQCVLAKSGCSAMPSSPRSELLFTARSSAVAVTEPLTTRLICPVAFSVIRKSFAPRKAIVTGWFRFDTTVRTLRLLSKTTGPLCAVTSPPPEIISPARSTGAVIIAHRHARDLETNRPLWLSCIRDPPFSPAVWFAPRIRSDLTRPVECWRRATGKADAGDDPRRCHKLP